ncbi:MAG TPA: LysE family transporter [Spirochaetota bacterium]|nr:LysE family transporter [Spirochaetota bacterium]HPJ35785.1 LysE family transporter [Spirochaetota bacterium]
MTDLKPAITFIFQSVLITIPGLLTPGPVMAVTIERGTKSPHAGVFVTLGHVAVELPLVVLLFLGLEKFTKEPCLRFILALAGSIFLFYLAWKTFRVRNMTGTPSAGVYSSSFVAGALMTLANPFLLLWWGTIGSVLILRSMELGLAVSVLFYVFHVLSNIIWLYFLSWLSYEGNIVIGRRYRYFVAIICGGILLVFGGYFIITALKIITI